MGILGVKHLALDPLGGVFRLVLFDYPKLQKIKILSLSAGASIQVMHASFSLLLSQRRWHDLAQAAQIPKCFSILQATQIRSTPF